MGRDPVTAATHLHGRRDGSAPSGVWIILSFSGEEEIVVARHVILDFATYSGQDGFFNASAGEA